MDSNAEQETSKITEVEIHEDHHQETRTINIDKKGAISKPSILRPPLSNSASSHNTLKLKKITKKTLHKESSQKINK